MASNQQNEASGGGTDVRRQSTYGASQIAAEVFAKPAIEEDGFQHVIRVDRCERGYVLDWRPGQARLIDRITITQDHRFARRFDMAEVDAVMQTIRALHWDPVALRDFSL